MVSSNFVSSITSIMLHKYRLGTLLSPRPCSCYPVPLIPHSPNLPPFSRPLPPMTLEFSLCVRHAYLLVPLLRFFRALPWRICIRYIMLFSASFCFTIQPAFVYSSFSVVRAFIIPSSNCFFFHILWATYCCPPRLTSFHPRVTT